MKKTAFEENGHFLQKRQGKVARQMALRKRGSVPFKELVIVPPYLLASLLFPLFGNKVEHTSRRNEALRSLQQMPEDKCSIAEGFTGSLQNQNESPTKMQIKTIRRYYFTPTRMVTVKKPK